MNVMRWFNHTLLRHVVLWLFVVIAVGPLLWIMISAFKSSQEIALHPFGLPEVWRWQNFARAWNGGFGRYTWNTVLMTVPAVILSVSLSTLAGYAFARFRFPGGRFAFVALLYGLTIPIQALMIPLFYNFARFGLVNDLPGLIAALVAVHLPFGVFLMRSFFMQGQQEIADAARIDGCSEYGVFWYMMLPLSRAGVLALTTIHFTDMWKAFLLPLVLIHDDARRPLTLGLSFYRTAQGAQQYELLAAGMVIASIPAILVFLAANRYFQRGLVTGSVK